MKNRILYIVAILSLIQVMMYSQSSTDISADLYFNEGNKAYSEGQFGDAVYQYERALLLEPNANDIKVNLQLAVENLETDIIELEPFFLSEWWQGLTNMFLPGSWKLLSVLFLIGLLFIVFLYLIKSKLTKDIAYSLSGLLSFMFLVSVLAGQSRSNNIYDNGYGIVSRDATALYEGPDLVSVEVKSVVSGVKVKVLDSNNDWYKVSAMDSEQGWILKENIRMLKFEK